MGAPHFPSPASGCCRPSAHRPARRLCSKQALQHLTLSTELTASAFNGVDRRKKTIAFSSRPAPRQPASSCRRQGGWHVVIYQFPRPSAWIPTCPLVVSRFRIRGDLRPTRGDRHRPNSNGGDSLSCHLCGRSTIPVRQAAKIVSRPTSRRRRWVRRRCASSKTRCTIRSLGQEIPTPTRSFFPQPDRLNVLLSLANSKMAENCYND